MRSVGRVGLEIISATTAAPERIGRKINECQLYSNDELLACADNTLIE